MRYEAEQNAGQAIYNRLHLQDERNRMTRIINAYKKLNQYTVYYSCTFCFYVLFVRVYLFSTLLQFAICKNNSNNRLQIIAILRLFLIFLATLCTFVKSITLLMCFRLQYALLIAKLWKIAIHIGKPWLFSNSHANPFGIL